MTNTTFIGNQVKFTYSSDKSNNQDSLSEESKDLKINELHNMKKELEGILDMIPGAIRVREGGGYENLIASLSVTLVKFGIIK